jgi:pimeloyl-ACP methyl ester carboxylesterase
VRISGLVLLAAPVVWRTEQATLDALRDVVRGRRSQIFDRTLFAPSTPLDVMREAWMEQVKTDPRVLHGDLVAAQGFDTRPLLGAIRLPTLVVHGDGDRLVAAAEAHALADAIEGARFVSIEGAGHIPQLEQPARLHELLTTFAAGLP